MDLPAMVLETGIEEIDQQHRQLVRCLDQLAEFADGSYGFAANFTALNTLLDYTRQHFVFEEDLLARCNYPLLAEHIAEHQAITAKVTALWRAIEAGEEAEASVVLTIRSWILEHINAEDTQYARFIAISRGC